MKPSEWIVYNMLRGSCGRVSQPVEEHCYGHAESGVEYARSCCRYRFDHGRRYRYYPAQ